MTEKKMTLQGIFFMLVTMVAATTRSAGAVVLNAAVDLRGEQGEFLQMLFKQLDTLVSQEQQDTKEISQVESLQVVPSVTITGNITDPERRLTLTFTLHASRTPRSGATIADDADDDDDDEEDDEWRSSTGVLTPLVDVVEPYFLSFVELVVNGILSTVISNFLEGSNLLGDVRLV